MLRALELTCSHSSFVGVEGSTIGPVKLVPTHALRGQSPIFIGLRAARLKPCPFANPFMRKVLVGACAQPHRGWTIG
jgi:hypothetical protein